MSTAGRDALTASEVAAGTSDEVRRRLVPCFDLLYDSLVEVVAPAVPPTANILELGTGSGVLSHLLAQRLPGAKLTLLGESPETLAEAAARLSAARIDHRAVQGDVAGDLPDGPFDAVVAGLAVHRMVDDEKRELFARVHRQLAPDGVFAFADSVAGPSLQLDDLYHQTWLRQVRAGGVLPEEVEAAVQEMVFDHPVPVAELLAWLVEAGLRDVDCFFKQYRFAVLGGWSGSLPSA